MRNFFDAVRSCFKPAGGRVMQNCLSFMRGRKAERLAFALSQKMKKIGKAKCVPKCKQNNFFAVTVYELK
jgi:hypothetical protein